MQRAGGQAFTCAAGKVGLVLFSLKTGQQADGVVTEGVVVGSSCRADHLFIDGAHLVYLAPYRRSRVVVGTVVEVVFHRSVVV